MALILRRSSPELLTTDEMTPEQFSVFESGWIGYETFLLTQDGITDTIAARTARSQFDEMRSTGFAARNQNVLKNRAIRKAI